MYLLFCYESHLSPLLFKYMGMLISQPTKLCDPSNERVPIHVAPHDTYSDYLLLNDVYVFKFKNMNYSKIFYSLF